MLRWRVVPVMGDGGGRLEVQKAWDDGPWRTAGVFASRAAARVFFEDRVGYGLALTCVTFVAQLVAAMLLLVLLFGAKSLETACRAVGPSVSGPGLVASGVTCL